MSTSSSADPSSSPNSLPADLSGVGTLTLVQLVQADQERRWATGDRPIVEDYLQRYPRLRDNAEAMVALLFQELRLRQKAGEQPQVDEFAARFPELAELLRGLLNLRDSVACAAPAAVTAASVAQQPTIATAAAPPQTGPFEDRGVQDVGPQPTTAPDTAGMALPAVAGYTVLGVLGRGGMGVVYKARQTGLRRIVALKMVLHGNHIGDGERHRFQAEAEAIAQLAHPNIVQVYEVGEHGGAPYFSLEYCAGGSLEKQLDGTPWEAKRAAELIQMLAGAVHAAHQTGLVHRDLKPGNILLTADGVPKVTDFGLVKRLDVPGHTQTGAVVGTPSYMAPEQARAEAGQVGPAADVYALGAILYELLTGRPPFKAATPLDTVLQVLSEEPVALRRLQPKVPSDLETICHKCLEKDPHQRYQSAAALSEDLRRFGAEEPVMARPVGPVGRLVKWARRRPAVASLVVTVALVAAIGLAGVLWAYGEARKEALRANEQTEQARQQAKRVDDKATEARAAEVLARRQQEKAQKEAATARAVTHFLTDDLLAEAAPENNPVGNKLTVRELLDRAARKMDTRFGLFEEPEVEATVRFTLGETYRQLGEYAQAEKHLGRSFALRKEVLGLTDPQTLVALNNLALSVKLQRKLTEAEPLYRAALDASTQALGAEHRTTLTLLNNLAQLLVELGRHAEAEPLMQRCTETRRRALGEHDNDTLVSMNNLASYWQQQGKWAEAEPLYRRTLALRRELLTSDHPDTIITMRNLGTLLVARSNLIEAEALLREAVEASRRVNGANHTVTLLFTNDLAGALADRGKREEAESLLRGLVKAQRAALPAGHRDLGLSLGTLARVVTDAKEGEGLARESLGILRKTLLPGHWVVASNESVLGGCLSAQGRYAEAETLLVDSYAKLAKAKGASPPRLAEAHARLVRLYEGWGRPNKAAEWRAKAPGSVSAERGAAAP
jgi:tetratricopeptide (TPR) repeat protein